MTDERRVHIFTKPLLTLANSIALKRGYNRAIEPEHIKQQPDNTLWAVVIALPHEHAAGKPVDTHIRCGIRPLTQVDENSMKIDSSDLMLFVDTDMDVFGMLPYSVPVKEKNTPASVAGDESES